MSDFEQAVYDGCPKNLPEGSVRVWLDDGQGGGSWEVRTAEEQEKHCDHCDSTNDVQGPDYDRVCKGCREDVAALDKEWQQERAMQAGMAFGCQGYNDAMGY